MGESNVEESKTDNSASQVLSQESSGNSLRNVWLKYRNISTGSGMFSGEQPSEKGIKQARSMGSFEVMNRTGIFSVRLAKNLSLDENMEKIPRTLSKVFENATPRCVEVPDADDDPIAAYCLNSSGKNKEGRLSEEIRQQKRQNHISKSTADDSDICVRDLEKLMFTKPNRASRGVDSVFSGDL